MKLRVVQGLAEAEDVLARFDPLDLDSLPESVVERTRQAFGPDVTPEQSVVTMLRDVRRDGDSAIRRYASLLDGAELEEFRVSDAKLSDARSNISGELEAALRLASRENSRLSPGYSSQELGGLGTGPRRDGSPPGAGGPLRPRGHGCLSLHRPDDGHTGACGGSKGDYPHNSPARR